MLAELAERKFRAVDATFAALLDWVLETQDPRAAAAIVRKMKRALVAYLAEDLDAAAEAGAAPARRPRSSRRR